MEKCQTVERNSFAFPQTLQEGNDIRMFINYYAIYLIAHKEIVNDICAPFLKLKYGTKFEETIVVPALVLYSVRGSTVLCVFFVCVPIQSFFCGLTMVESLTKQIIPNSNFKSRSCSEMSKFSSVAELNSFLQSKSYITGYSYTADDKSTLESLNGIPDQSSFPYAYRWAVHIAVLVGINKLFLLLII